MPSEDFPQLENYFLDSFVAFFISSSALILNDYFDLEVDKINAPNRPLPSGAVSKSEVIALTIITTLVGLGASFAINTTALILGAIFWFVGFLYNWKLKATGLLGNLMVASSVAVTFILGGFVVGQPWNKIVWLFSLMAFCLDLGEEIASGAMDVAGDKKRNSKSIAISMGKNVAINISSSLFALVVLISLIPIFLGWLGASYFLMILIADTIIVFFTYKLGKSRTSDQGRYYLRGIYLGELVGLLAFITGQFFF